MRYYKIIKDEEIIGAITSNNFIRYQPVIGCFLRGDETNGEYISYNGKLYRSTWMVPVTKQEEYIQVVTIEIDEVEYNMYIAAIESNERIIVQPVYEVEVEPEYVDTNVVASVTFLQNAKIKEMSSICRTTIENGFDLELRGEMHHFSLDTQDQLNLISLSAMAQTQEYIPYHADGESCIFYTAEEINAIIAAATQFKIYHTTYFNALKTYINSLETIEEIAAIEYGVEIPEEYKSDVLKALEQ